jgi:hypothetical protein
MDEARAENRSERGLACAFGNSVKEETPRTNVIRPSAFDRRVGSGSLTAMIVGR